MVRARLITEVLDVRRCIVAGGINDTMIFFLALLHKMQQIRVQSE